MEIRTVGKGVKLRQSNQTDKRIELTMKLLKLLHSNGIFIPRTADLGKTANIYMNWLPFSLLLTTSTDAVLVTFGRTINYLFYNALHEENQTSQESSSPKVPQKPNFIVILNAWTWNANCSLWTRNAIYKDFTTTMSKV